MQAALKPGELIAGEVVALFGEDLNQEGRAAARGLNAFLESRNAASFQAFSFCLLAASTAAALTINTFPASLAVGKL